MSRKAAAQRFTAGLREALPQVDVLFRLALEDLIEEAQKPQLMRLTQDLRIEGLERHVQLATVGGRRPRAEVFVVSREALRLFYMTISGEAEVAPDGVCLHLPTEAPVVVVSANVAARAVNGVSPALVHELVHATQPKTPRPRFHDDPEAQLQANHWADFICEGVTELLTEVRTGSTYGTYITEPIVLDELIAGLPGGREELLVGLSETEWDERARKLAELLYGDPEREADVWDLCAACESAARGVIGDLRSDGYRGWREREPQMRRSIRDAIGRALAGTKGKAAAEAPLAA